MLARYAQLSKHPNIFRSLTGLSLNQFHSLCLDLVPLIHSARQTRLDRPKRQRAYSSGGQTLLEPRDQLLLTIVWLRCYPTNELLGYLFGVSDSTASRVIARTLPLLAANGRDGMRQIDPGRQHRLNLPDLLKAVPDLAVIVDSFEQTIQRPQTHSEADRYYSGKKKTHTLKCQVTVEATTGRLVHLSASVAGPIADYKLLKQSGVLAQLGAEVGMLGDLAYFGLNSDLDGRGASPRRKPRGKERPVEDLEYNRAFAKVRIVVEHTIGRLRCYQSLRQLDRHHRVGHNERVQAVAGLVNRVIEAKMLRYKLAA